MFIDELNDKISSDFKVFINVLTDTKRRFETIEQELFRLINKKART